MLCNVYGQVGCSFAVNWINNERNNGAGRQATGSNWRSNNGGLCKPIDRQQICPVNSSIYGTHIALYIDRAREREREGGR